MDSPSDYEARGCAVATAGAEGNRIACFAADGEIARGMSIDTAMMRNGMNAV